jgi:hypothetical protein
MSKRKGDSYLGGHTVITLHPGTVEAGLVEQAREHKQQARDDQQRLDQLRVKQSIDADLADFQSYSPTRHAQQNAERFYRDRVLQIERVLKTNPHPRIMADLLQRQLDLLEKLRAVVQHVVGATLPGQARGNRSTERKIAERISHTRRKLERQLGRRS